MAWYFGFFFLSGFCGILYELIWLRLTMAQYGVTTALVSITLSMFMLGMGIGSWGIGALARQFEGWTAVPLRMYALTEFVIGCSSLVVPAELVLGRHLLAAWAGNTSMSSATYYLISGVVVAFTLLPWCVCMGATYPLAMSAIRCSIRSESHRSFSYLYLSNVIGALAGAIVPLLLIELYGFHATLRVGLLLNFVIAGSAFALSWRNQDSAAAPEKGSLGPQPRLQTAEKSDLALLFLTGLSTMGMEVVWIRLFTPYVGPLVYSFAGILACYLLATFVGSLWYRSESRKGIPQNHLAWVVLSLVGLFALFAADPRVLLTPVQRICIGIAPFSLLIGFLTPMLVDRWSGGDPDRAGRAYAVNVMGCILGPLLSGFVLLPAFGEHLSILLYCLPWMVMAFNRSNGKTVRMQERGAGIGIVAFACLLFFLTKSYETLYPVRRVLRDSTATVIATGTGMTSRLITNGVGMTMLTPITKMMAHLTLASLNQQPRNVLVICFGMGTTYRSVSSWGVSETAAELVPSVPRLFSYYHEDGDRILSSPRSHVVIDDGRRFLERSGETFDAIILDPPPPVESAASSLLYSEEFYAVAKQRLSPTGILQQWLPYGDKQVQASVAKALRSSFPYVRVYRSVTGWGWHFLASMSPIPERNASDLVARMPPAAVKDMMEWGPAATPAEQFDRILSTKTTLQELIGGASDTPPMQDDRPINEYFFLRDLAAKN